ncbi:MAG: hypothetical protein DRJ07_00255 [Bacteroidetes bacterium]|nr:MAG: hypothetical protein DRJ07_00255 [Bacteroidota bacterium]
MEMNKRSDIKTLSNKNLFNKWVKQKTLGREKTVVITMLLIVFLGVVYVFFNRSTTSKKKSKNELNIGYEVHKISNAISINKLSNISEGYGLYKEYEEMLSSNSIDSIELKKLENKLQKFLDHD